MKISINQLKKSVLAIVAIVSTAVLFTSCLKTDNPSNPNPGASGLMAFHLAADKPAVGFGISGSIFTNQPVGFGNYTGAYVSVYPGTGTVEAYDYNSSSKVAISPVVTFDTGKYYSAFLVGKDTALENIVVEDNLDSLPYTGGQAYVRYINAVADSTIPSVKISAGGTEVVNAASAFKTISAFTPVTAGDIIVSISNESSTISANRTLSVEAGKIYTLLLMGKPGSADPSNQVQIKYITNGTITP